MRKAVAIISLLALSSLSAAPVGDVGPPAFVTYPILLHVAEPAMENGHFAMGPGESLVPAPLVRSAGSASFAPATFAASSLATGTDRDVSNASDSYQGETGAVSNALYLVGGSNSIYPGNCSAAAAPGTFGDCAPRAYSSGDGGSNWVSSALPRTWNGTTFGIGFDPAIDVDKDGVFYFSYGVAPLGGSYPNAIVMVQSTDGQHWTQLTPVTFNQGGAFDDKYYLAIDRSSNIATANRIYVAWDRNKGNNQTLYVASSSDRGKTWTAPVKVNDGTTKFERVIGAYPAVDHNNGTVYVSWHDYAKNKIFVDKSTDGGTTWGTDVAAATTHAGFGKDIGCVGGRSQGPAHALKVGPSGALYLVYADPTSSGRDGKGFDVLLTKSTDSGAHWSAPVSLNDDATTNDQFHPTLAVESNGAGGDRVTVSFYDRRGDPNNCLAQVYATQSTNSGATWSANTKQTSAASNFDGNPNGPGDYSSATPFGSAVWPFFSDHRNPDFEIYTVNVE
jgi:hypothetical protein